MQFLWTNLASSKGQIHRQSSACFIDRNLTASSALGTGIIGCRVGSESQHPLGWTGPWQGTSPTSCSDPHPVWPWNLQGWRRDNLSAPLFWCLAVLVKKMFFFMAGCNLSFQFIAIVWVTVSTLQLSYSSWYYITSNICNMLRQFKLNLLKLSKKEIPATFSRFNRFYYVTEN